MQQQIMNKETISIKVEGRGEAVTFHLGMISVADDAEFMQRFTQISDLEPRKKSESEYKIYADALAAWSTDMPVKSNGTGKEEKLGKGTPEEAIRAYFADKSNAKEWVAVAAITAFRNSLYPKVTFQ